MLYRQDFFVMTRVMHLRSGPNLVPFKLCLVRTNQLYPTMCAFFRSEYLHVGMQSSSKGFGFYTQPARTFSIVFTGVTQANTDLSVNVY